MTIVDTFSASLLRSQPAGASVRLRSQPTLTTPTISIVVPTLNNEASLPQLIQSLETTLRGQFYEVVFVDDGSSDGTWRVISATLAQHRNWQAIRLTRQFGDQAALLAGTSAARGRAVIMLDPDGRQQTGMLGRMIDEWKAGAKVVQMIRSRDGSASWFKKSTSYAGDRLYSALCGFPMSRAASDFRLMDRAVVDSILEQPAHGLTFKELIPWLGYHTVEIEYVAPNLAAGPAGYPSRAMTQDVMNGLTTFSFFPLRILKFSGAIVTPIAICYLVGIVASGLTGPGFISSWKIVAGLITLFGGAQVLAVGTIGEYIGRLHHAHLSRPPYVIEEQRGLGKKRNSTDESNKAVAHRRNRKQSESVRLITTHIGQSDDSDDFTRQAPINTGERIDIVSRIESMRREEAAHAPQTP